MSYIYDFAIYMRFCEVSNLCSALTAYCFCDNKPEALPVYVEKSRQLELFAY